MRDLEFSSSARRGNGGPKAPKRILGAKVLFSHSGSKKCKFWSEMRKLAKITLFAPGGKKAGKRNGIWLLLDARNAINEFWSKIQSIFPYVKLRIFILIF